MLATTDPLSTNNLLRHLAPMSQLNAISPAIARIANNRCAAFTKTGNPCRNHKKMGGEYCGKHDSEEKRPEAKQSNRVEAKLPEAKQYNFMEAIARSDRCTKLTTRGVQCKHLVNNGSHGLCKRHLRAEGNLEYLNNFIERQRSRSEQAVINNPARDIMDDDISDIVSNLRQVSFEEYEYSQPILHPPRSRMGVPFPRAGAGAMGYKTNMKTLRECECDICAEDKKRMIMLHCCRKEMCADCMKRITNAKCPFCKQDNNMLID